ncbi:Hypothetical protein CCH01_014240 [Clostridium chauvoei JF4335]|nr:Hypothetical protein CCH01_014240 [Clostridium chauvoei JF4335]
MIVTINTTLDLNVELFFLSNISASSNTTDSKYDNNILISMHDNLLLMSTT